ncbi:MAG: DNA repair protein RecN [Synechococcaceae cyanobacterium RL_1_2]|nr:DNA repair protein RecN [Synechococcaceae cyanobacterium RL_1_2]
MLLLLKIANFALVDSLELEFASGLNVLTGETGAGKSIILDAIDLLLGAKASPRFLRTGETRASLEGTFELTSQLGQWLEEQEIELLEDDTMVVARELTLNKNHKLRSRSRINGVLVNRETMANLREHLVEITAQGQTVQLTSSQSQRELIDLFGGDKITRQKKLVETAHQQYQQICSKLKQRLHSQQETLQRIDLLKFQQRELEEVGLGAPDELDQLHQQNDMLSHTVELQQLSCQAYELLYQNEQDQPSVADLLGEAEGILNTMANYDPQIEPLLELVTNALTQAIEAGQQINSYGDRLDSDPETLAEIQQRMAQLKQICRKYGPTLAEVIIYYDQLQQELSELTGAGESLEELELACQNALEELQGHCQKLTELRQTAAAKLEKQLIKELKPLAMDKVIFQCRLKPINPTPQGADEVNYYFSPNPGEEMKPLGEIASGGEMSRFLLALKSCFVDLGHRSHTLIFDEIDAGVSGKVAQAIASKLKELSHRHQVLCVTHQPLVAAVADNHYRVDKTITNTKNTDPRTIVKVRKLDDLDRRKQELAELTGGHAASDAIAFAESILKAQHAHSN